MRSRLSIRGRPGPRPFKSESSDRKARRAQPVERRPFQRLGIEPFAREREPLLLVAQPGALPLGELGGAQVFLVVGGGWWFDLPDPVCDLLPVPPACGANNIDALDGVTLELTMLCDPADPCPAQEIPLCK